MRPLVTNRYLATRKKPRRRRREEEVVWRCAQVSQGVRALEREKQMGKLQKFEITFDQAKSVYSPGESISGQVTVKLEQSLQCKGESSVFFNSPVQPRLAPNEEVVESPLRSLFVKTCFKYSKLKIMFNFSKTVDSVTLSSLNWRRRQQILCIFSHVSLLL